MTAPRTIEGGRVIIFEGIDGVGKTTQIEKAAEALQTEGWLVRTTRSHGGTEIGELLRDVSLNKLIERTPKTNFRLSMTIHESHVPSLERDREKGSITLIDRGPLSLAAYQIFGDGAPEEWAWPNVDEDIELWGADMIITYTAAVNVSLARAKQAPGYKADYFEDKGVDYFERVSQGFDVASERYHAHTISAEQPIEPVHVETMAAIRQLLNK